MQVKETQTLKVLRGMSASKMRKAAQDNDYNSFKKGLPMGYRDGEKLFKDVQRQMKVKGFREWADDLMILD